MTIGPETKDIEITIIYDRKEANKHIKEAKTREKSIKIE